LSWHKTDESFIFSFNNKDINNAIISDIENTNFALYNNYQYGPHFGDITIYSSNRSSDYNNIYYKKQNYKKRIRDSESNFYIEDYEVFQIVKC
ncbi:hypothetical protein GLOIN_2v1732199, partial [Rhizophagus irregularis DAOM 181602=DAOM 197198]